MIRAKASDFTATKSTGEGVALVSRKYAPDGNVPGRARIQQPDTATLDEGAATAPNETATSEASTASFIG